MHHVVLAGRKCFLERILRCGVSAQLGELDASVFLQKHNDPVSLTLCSGKVVGGVGNQEDAEDFCLLVALQPFCDGQIGSLVAMANTATERGISAADWKRLPGY